MWRLFYNKETGIINHLIRSRIEQTTTDERFAWIDFETKPEINNVKVNIETKQLEALPEPEQILFPTAGKFDREA